MKKIKIILSAALIIVLLLLSACGEKKAADGKIKLICTAFPQYNWALNIIGDRSDKLDVRLLCGASQDLHSYQASAQDMVELSDCDILIYCGVSDLWAAQAAGEGAQLISMTQALGDAVIYTEHDGQDGHEHSENEADEHTWLSLKNAQELCLKIKDALCAADPMGKSEYEVNCGVFRQSIAVLSADYENAVKGAKRNFLLFADRFPFAYMCRDYSLEYTAAFEGCSAESEASFETVSELSNALKAQGLPAVLITETADGELARTVIKNSGCEAQILRLNSMQSANDAELNSKSAYLDIMRENLAVLKTALN